MVVKHIARDQMEVLACVDIADSLPRPSKRERDEADDSDEANEKLVKK